MAAGVKKERRGRCTCKERQREIDRWMKKKNIKKTRSHKEAIRKESV